MDTDEIDPPRPTAAPVKLDEMSIEDLKEYVQSLESEMRRAEAMIDKKESHKSGADSLFNF